MQLTGLDRFLWVSSFVGHCALLAVLFSRRRATSFPLFTSLIALNVVRTVILYVAAVRASHSTYFYTYWILGFVDVSLQFGIAFELAAHTFRPLGVWAPDVRRSFAIVLGVGIAVASLLTWLSNPVTRTAREAVVARSSIFASALLAELFVAMVALSVTMGLPWRTHAARLAQGLGTYSIFGIISDAAHSYFASGTTNDAFNLVTHLRMTLYLSCLTYWIVTLALPEPAARKMPEHLHQELVALQRRAALTLQLLRTTGTPS